MIRRASRSKQKTGRVTSFLSAMLRGRQRRELRRNQTTSYEYVTVGSATEVLEDRTLLDASEVSLSWDAGSLSENGGTDTLTATLDAIHSEDVTVYVTFSGSATRNSDYSKVVTDEIVITAGNLTGTMDVTGILDDDFDEGDEFITATADFALDSSFDPIAVTGPSVSTIIENVNVAKLEWEKPVFGEDGMTNDLRIYFEGEVINPVTVFLSFSGTATNNVDYTRSASFVTFSAGEDEKFITFTGLPGGAGKTIKADILNVNGDPEAVEFGVQSDTTTITDQALVNLDWDNGNFNENGGTDTLRATLSKALNEDLVITLDLSSSTATDTTDYLNPSGNTITVLAGQTEGTLTVTGVLDNFADVNETIVAEIADITPNGIEDGVQSATTIIEDEPIVTSLEWSKTTFVENQQQNTLTATLSRAVAQNVSIVVEFTGTAEEGIDFDFPAAKTIVILAGQTSGSFTITGKEDDVAETNETIIADVVSVTNATEIGALTDTTTITDDPVVKLSWQPGTISENGGTAQLVASLSKALTQSVTVDLSFSGTATTGLDYDNPSGNMIVIEAGELSGSIEVTALLDNVFDEPDEFIAASITGVTGASEYQSQIATVSIVDVPVVTLEWEKPDFSENGETNKLYAKLSGEVEDDVTVTVIYSGTATEDEDYTSTDVITILAGETEGFITVQTLFDNIIDHNETLIAEVSNVTNSVAFGEQIVQTIIREGNSTALDDYVNKFDPNYDYQYHSTLTGNGYTTYVINMISQKWRDETEVDKPIWQHWVSIVVPDEVTSDTAILYIDGSSNGKPAPTTTPEKAVEYALTSGMIVVHVPTIPSEPLQFADEGFTRTEDEIIAYTFDKYMEEYNADPNSTSAAEWPLLLPMVKSAVAGMNTAQDFADVNPFTIADFVVTGASKRGWTTWLTAAVDSRVIGIAPMVIDVLNMDESMVSHKEHFTHGITSGLTGGYSEQVEDYVNLNIMDRLDTAEGQALLKIVDPFEYRDRLTMPKYIVNAANDEFFVPNSSQFYINDLIGPTYMRYTPNVGHQFGDDDVRYYVEDIAEFFAQVDAEIEFPTYTWNVSSNEQNITVTVGEKDPVSVKLWRADNFTNAEFRNGYPSSASYVSSNIAGTGEEGKIFSANVSTPSSGAVAYFIEIVFEFEEGVEIAFTTEAVILYAPDPNVPEVTLFASADEMDENGGTVELTAFLEYALPFDLNVNLNFSGDATKADQIPDIQGGDDYSLYENYYSSLPFIFIPAGQTVGSMTIHALNDERFEGPETLVATIGSMNGAKAAPSNFQVSVDILDDEPPIGTALDDYVNTFDVNSGYDYHSTLTGAGYTTYVLDMTSQQWRDASEVDKPIWQHWVSIVVPDNVQSGTAILFIDGGQNSSTAPTDTDDVARELALNSGLIVVHVPTIPNEKLTFTDDGIPRTEDEIIAYTFDKFLTTGDDTWPLLLPMVKSAVVGMDSAQDFASSLPFSIDDFLVTGASKRGWTTWLTAAVDPRVVGIAPLVIDTLNMEENLINHKEHFSYGVTDGLVEGYSEQVIDYVEFDIFDRFSTEEGQDLLDIVDPYRYLQRLDMPKYIVNGSQDEYFVPSSSRYYIHDLEGQNYLRYVQNAGHGLNEDSVLDVAEYFAALDAGASLPEYSWTVSNQDRRITLNTQTLPVSVKLWKATNPLKAEFRLGYPDTVSYIPTNLSDIGGGTYIANVSPPATGAVAYFVEMVYNVNGTNIAFTTEAIVLYGLEEVVPEVSLYTNNLFLDEYWDVGTFTAVLDRFSDQDVIIDLGYSGSATNGTDYGAWMTQIVIPAGELFGSVQVQTIPDMEVEGDEEIRVDILNVTNGIEQGGVQWATSTIVDDDLPNVSLQVEDFINEYWDIATFTATLDRVSVFDTIVDLGISGSATQGVDYGIWQTQIVIPAGSLDGQIQVQSIPDTLIEANEGIQVDILNVTNGHEQGGLQRAVTTILDDDAPSVKLVADRQSMGEYWEVTSFIATLSQVSNKDVIIDLGYSGSATKGVDYGAWDSQIVIKAGKLSGYVVAQTIPDAVIEGKETIQVDILNVTNGFEDGNQVAKVDILDKDIPQVMVTADKQKIDEYWDVVKFTATLDRVAEYDVKVDVGYSGTAIQGTDYGAWESQIVIKAGELTGSIMAQAIPDSLPEDEESIVVDVLGVTNAELKTGQSSITVLIEDDDFGAFVGPNPNGPGQTLFVSAGDNNDDIQLTQKSGGVVNVVMNGNDLGDFGGINSIMIKGNGGNDTIELDQSVTFDAIIYGGPGNDIIRGGSGDDLILGGTGSDNLDGGFQGRDVLIGGDGADFFNENSVTGGSSSDDGDIMIAGGTIYDNSPADLFAIHQEWASNKGANARINNLKNGTGVPKLDATTLLLNDGDLDTLYGTPGLDWLLFTNGQDSANPNGGDQIN